MSDKHRRLSPYVRNEEILQRGIEQTALAQTRAAMSNPTAAQVLIDRELLERLIQYVDLWLEVDGTLTPQSIEEVDSDLSFARLALIQADQQTRLQPEESIP